MIHGVVLLLIASLIIINASIYPCKLDFDQSFACTPKLLETRLESDICCIESAVTTIFNTMIQAKSHIFTKRYNHQFILTTCLNPLYLYDPNQASKYDIFFKLSSLSVDVEKLKTTIYSKVVGIFEQFEYLKSSIPNVYLVQLLLKESNNYISISYPRILSTDPCDNLFFTQDIILDTIPETTFVSSTPYIQNGLFDPIIKFGIPIYNQGTFWGMLYDHVFFSTLVSDILHNQPTQNGYYILVDLNGHLVGGSHTSIQWLYGTTQTITQITQNNATNTELYSNEGFRTIMSTIRKGESSLITKSNDVEYTLYISKLIQDLYYLIAIVPTTDLTLGASWSIREEQLTLRYLSTDKEVRSYFTIENNGLFTVHYSVDSMDVYTVSPAEGSIRGGAVKIITVTLCLEESCPSTTPSIIVRSTGDQTGSCFRTLVCPIQRSIADCKVTDFALYGSDCLNDKRKIRFDWLNPKSCFGGVDLPDPLYINCEHSRGTTYSLVVQLLSAVAAVLILYSFTLIVLSKYVIDVICRTQPPFVIFKGIGVLCICASCVIFVVNDNGSGCIFEGLFFSIGNMLIASSLLTTTQYSYILYYQSQIIFETTFSFCIKRVGPLVVVMIIAFFSLQANSNIYTIRYLFYTHEVVLKTCGINGFLLYIVYLIPCLVDIVSMYFSYHLYQHAEVDNETDNETIFGIICLFFHLVITLVYVFLPRNNGFILVILLFVIILFSFFIYLFYAPFSFNKKGQGDERAKMRQMTAYQQLLDESITRSMLKSFMRTLLQEESILFWEEIHEFRRYTKDGKYDKDEMLRRVHFIYNTYIIPQSEYEVNISDVMRQEITKELNSDIKVTIFDKAFEEINRLIIFNNVVPFCVSQQAKDANKIRQWWSTYQNLEAELQKGVKDKMSEIIYYTGLNGTILKPKSNPTKSIFG